MHVRAIAGPWAKAKPAEFGAEVSKEDVQEVTPLGAFGTQRQRYRVRLRREHPKLGREFYTLDESGGLRHAYNAQRIGKMLADVREELYRAEADMHPGFYKRALHQLTSLFEFFVSQYHRA